MATVKDHPPFALQDQLSINRYAYLTFKSNKTARALEKVKTAVGNQKEALEELSVFELEDEQRNVAVVAGKAFFHVPVEHAKVQAEIESENKESDLETLQHELNMQKIELARLKNQLESKFGDSIRLE